MAAKIYIAKLNKSKKKLKIRIKIIPVKYPITEKSLYILIIIKSAILVNFIKNLYKNKFNLDNFYIINWN